MSEWNHNTFIQNFRNCRAGQFDAIREALGIKMSDEKLTDCAVYCGVSLRRDPTVGELKLWDRLAALSASPATATLALMETKSPAIAETFADMMEKRREVSAGSAPLSLEDAFMLATRALERGGKTPETDVCLRLDDCLIPDVEAGVTEEGSEIFLSLLGQPQFARPEAGDFCLLAEPAELTGYEFRKAIGTLINGKQSEYELHAAFPVGKGGILPALLPLFGGSKIDLRRLCNGENASPEILANAFTGDWIFVVSKSSADAVLEEMERLGIKGTFFATLVAGKKTTIGTDVHLLPVSTDFLRSLSDSRKGLAIEPTETPENGISISNGPHVGPFCRFLPQKSTSALVRVDGLFVGAASAPLANGAFQTAVMTALAPVLSCAASGVGYSELRLASALTIPEDNFEPSVAFGAAIGLYRLQAELGIPTAAFRMTEKDIPAQKLAIFAFGKGEKIPPSALTTPDSNVYFLPVELTGSGLPDFEKLRDLLDDLTAQARHGDVIRSAKVVTGDLRVALREMRQNGLYARMNKKQTTNNAIGILVETGYEMSYPLVATVKCGRSAAMQPLPQLLSFPQENGLIWRRKPEVTILAAPNDRDAFGLAEYMKAAGATVTVFGQKESGQFLRAVLTSSMVFLSRDVELQKSPQAVFAFSVFNQNGGKLVIWDPADGKKPKIRSAPVWKSSKGATK